MMGKTLVKWSYKYRFCPTVAQRRELLRTFGCVRKVYNLALEARSRAWADDRRHVNYSETSAMLTSWKKSAELAYLAEVSSVPLQQALRHLQSAFNAFFSKRSKYPRFKSKKRTRASAEHTRSAFRYSDGVLKLAKMTEPLSVVWSRPLPDGAVPSTVTVWRDNADRWFVSILVESVVEHHLPTADAVGLDAGITTLLTLSTGEKITNPNHTDRERKRLARAQRALNRKCNGSSNREKARLKVARIHSKIGDRRRDYLHKVTTRLVRENQAVVIEDLAVQNMIKNRRLARHDRDINAARNILAAGLAVSACGADVRPQQGSSPERAIGCEAGTARRESGGNPVLQG